MMFSSMFLAVGDVQFNVLAVGDVLLNVFDCW